MPAPHARAPRPPVRTVRARAPRTHPPRPLRAQLVPRAVVDKCLEAANWAPTHGKTEPWRFVVFQGAEAYSRMQDAKRRATERLMAETPELLASALKKMERKAKQMDKDNEALEAMREMYPN